MKKLMMISAVSLALISTGCNSSSQESKDRQAVQRQQEQYAASQPVPAYDWSLERHLVIELYNIRNMKAATHSVWRSEYGMIEGDCPSMGFGIPYDTSLTNPLQSVGNRSYALTSIEQAEPNGIFASKNTSATWVMCVNEAGVIEPVYVESKVTVYPYPVKIDYDRNFV
ncbi:TPA: hypothetical protein NKQ64_004538, partial [Vibrio parahaemolyticus]|nr:hypothetical protein [Vibrio parahaemolyticus]HCE2923573.1 hypothetical protein [Vibrio parahaemolyticus]HCH1769764.1 hypothetical protein [Vibrio parahaemolyticus]HCH5178769.1 hypothetical protein [Vibrio parahaemolyticus]